MPMSLIVCSMRVQSLYGPKVWRAWMFTPMESTKESEGDGVSTVASTRLQSAASASVRSHRRDNRFTAELSQLQAKRGMPTALEGRELYLTLNALTNRGFGAGI